MAGLEQTVGHYRILDRIAAGGMGVVYRAEDLTLHRLVALKFLSPSTSADEEYRARFLREARVAAGLNHQHTCTVYEVGEVTSEVDSNEAADSIISPGTLFIAMEFIEGETLAARLSRAGRLSAHETLEVASQIAEGLAEAHARRIVHRDLKPQNVMVTHAGLVKIVDFGLAKPLRSVRNPGALTTTSEMISAELDEGVVIGTCAYMSPEQAARKAVDPRSDVFSFGIMLYEMLAGRLPFRGDTPTVILAKILEAEPDPLPDGAGSEVSAGLARMVRTCLQKRPEDRYPDARHLVAELRSLHEHPSEGATTPWGGARGWLAAGAILLLIVVGLAYVGVRRVLHTREQVTSASIDPPSIRSDAAVSTPSEDVVVNPGAALVSEQNPRPQVAATPTTAAANSLARAPVANTQPVELLSPAPDTGTLVLDSSPPSSVTLDGTLIGITPLTIETGPGEHAVVMASPDGRRWRGSVEVVAGERSLVGRDLGATGRLTITSDVWVDVSLDGGRPEPTPVDFSQIAAGLHDLQASRAGYVTQTREILIEEGRTTYLRLKLEKQP